MFFRAFRANIFTPCGVFSVAPHLLHHCGHIPVIYFEQGESCWHFLCLHWSWIWSVGSFLPSSFGLVWLGPGTSVLWTYWPSPLLHPFVDGMMWTLVILCPLFYVVRTTISREFRISVTYDRGMVICVFVRFLVCILLMIEMLSSSCLLVRGVPLKSFYR